MQRNSEFPLFLQSAIAIVGFILFLSLVGWAMQPRGAFSTRSSNFTRSSNAISLSRIARAYS